MAKLFLIKSNVADYPSTGVSNEICFSFSTKICANVFRLFTCSSSTIFFASNFTLQQFFHTEHRTKSCDEKILFRNKICFSRQDFSFCLLLSLSLFYSKYLFFLEENFLLFLAENWENSRHTKPTFLVFFLFFLHSAETRKIFFSEHLVRQFSQYPENACSTSFNPRRRGWWMNDHDIVTIDQKQKLINKTEKYKNTRKENFFLCCLYSKNITAWKNF